MNITSYKNRGMFLENILNDTNTYYNSKEKCIIYKKPTPIKVLNVCYPNNKSHLIDKAVYSNVSTLDYNGIYKERYIEFDAKECQSKTSFPLSNIKSHQIQHIINIIKQKGIIFLIIMMNNQFYLLKGEDLINIIEKDERKSIEYKKLQEIGYKIEESYLPRLKYLDAVDKAYFKE
ncbi:MAG: Holliday junction resolvase RecU [Tenericutes bacterium]|nr:Holliday junction resolvase RecU [Mycoplasmatota bacterium]